MLTPLDWWKRDNSSIMQSRREERLRKYILETATYPEMFAACDADARKLKPEFQELAGELMIVKNPDYQPESAEQLSVYIPRGRGGYAPIRPLSLFYQKSNLNR